MARTFGDFARNLRQLGNELPVRVNALKVLVAATANNDLVRSTPVDTGTTMANWIVNADEAATEIRPAFVPSPKGFVSKKGGAHIWTHRVDPDITRNANLSPALEAAQATLDSIQPEQTIHITNNVPHIGYLNDGTTSHPPIEFVERAIMLARDVVNRATIVG